jgi:hypothetical protein
MANTEIAAAPQELDAGMMVRRALFLVLLGGLTLYYLGLDFRGLSTPKGMEQAVVAREIAKGNGFVTTIQKPLAWTQTSKREKDLKGPSAQLNLNATPDTYHSPLNPLINSLVLGFAKGSWELGDKQAVYTPDMLIAGVSMVLLLASIGITYLLVSRIFDARIGGVTALLLLLCELLWKFSQTGLPQMLMLFLFSFGTYFLYKAVESEAQGRGTVLWLALTGGFFGLLALAHWLTLWIFIGLLVFVAVYFTRRVVLLGVLIGIVGLITGIWAYLNFQSTGNPLGAGLYAFYAGLGGASSEEALFRDLEQTVGGLNFQGFLRKIVANSLAQVSELYGYLGGVVAAPLFFLSLMHPFRRKEIADFRWAILLMWLFGVIGMTLYGIKPLNDTLTHENNLHILFVPLMTGYGLAFLSVLWNRLSLPLEIPAIRNGHFVLAVLVSSLPFLMNLPPRLIDLNRIDKEFRVQYPTYVPRLIKDYASLVPENEIIVSDIPWAVSWYGNRSSFWLPKDQGQLNRLMVMGKDKGTPLSAMLLSPGILWSKLNEVSQPRSEFFDWRQYIMFYPAIGLAKNERDINAQQELLLTDLPMKNYFGVSSPFGNLYLFMSETKILPRTAAPSN